MVPIQGVPAWCDAIITWDTPLDKQTHNTENITFPQLRWWAVINRTMTNLQRILFELSTHGISLGFFHMLLGKTVGCFLLDYHPFCL